MSEVTASHLSNWNDSVTETKPPSNIENHQTGKMTVFHWHSLLAQKKEKKKQILKMPALQYSKLTQRQQMERRPYLRYTFIVFISFATGRHKNTQIGYGWINEMKKYLLKSFHFSRILFSTPISTCFRLSSSSEFTVETYSNTKNAAFNICSTSIIFSIITLSTACKKFQTKDSEISLLAVDQKRRCRYLTCKCCCRIKKIN